MKSKNKFFVIIICLTLVVTSLLIASAKKPEKPTPSNYLELPPIDKPNNPEEGFILYCDSSDGNLKALDIYGETTILAYLYSPPPTEVYVDDDFTSSTPGWGYNHFDIIQDGIDAVNESGTVYVYNGTYYETIKNYSYVFIDKSINLIGENEETTIIDCIITDDNYGGIYLKHGINNVKVSGFTVKGYNQMGIGIYVQRYNSNNIRIENCIVHSFSDGISLYNASNCIIENCTTYNNDRAGGITIPHEGNHTIKNCSSYSNSIGINLMDASNCRLFDNSITSNSYGIIIKDSGNNNLVMNNSIYDHNNFDNNGLWILNSNNNTVENNFITNNYRGIFIENSTENTISNCSIINNSGNEIQLYDSSNNNIIKCNILSGSGNQNLAIGVNSNYNIITENEIFGADIYGINIKLNSNFNKLYHNNIFNNNINAKDECINYWDNGYPSGGNFWDDYIGDDIYNGPNQNITGSDGIGDTPYIIPDGSNQDNYPLMNPI